MPLLVPTYYSSQLIELEARWAGSARFPLVYFGVLYCRECALPLSLTTHNFVADNGLVFPGSFRRFFEARKTNQALVFIRMSAATGATGTLFSLFTRSFLNNHVNSCY